MLELGRPLRVLVDDKTRRGQDSPLGLAGVPDTEEGDTGINSAFSSAASDRPSAHDWAAHVYDHAVIWKRIVTVGLPSCRQHWLSCRSNGLIRVQLHLVRHSFEGIPCRSGCRERSESLFVGLR
jgi:hypothetical protein